MNKAYHVKNVMILCIFILNNHIVVK